MNVHAPITPAALSVTAGVTAYIRSLSKPWAHDRQQTVGASEIGQCARKVFYLKAGIAPDAGFDEVKGAALRGDLIETHLWAPAVARHVAAIGGELLFAGAEQRTLVDGYLSATPDGLATNLPAGALAHHGVEDCGGTVALECKSIDPRVDLRQAKDEHFAQVQVQLGLIRHATPYAPDFALISYVDASFLDNVREYVIRFDPAIYANAKRRALQIMDATDALQLRPEGKMAGGKECDRCAWATQCIGATLAALPAKEAEIGDNARAAIEAAALEADEATAARKSAEAREAAAKESVKELLRANGTRKVSTGRVAVSYFPVKGRSALDTAAAAAAGIDLSPFNREGAPTERLTISIKEEE